MSNALQAKISLVVGEPSFWSDIGLGFYCSGEYLWVRTNPGEGAMSGLIDLSYTKNIKIQDFFDR